MGLQDTLPRAPSGEPPNKLSENCPLERRNSLSAGARSLALRVACAQEGHRSKATPLTTKSYKRRHGDLARWDGDFVPEQIVRASATAVDGSVIRRILAGVIVDQVHRPNGRMSPPAPALTRVAIVEPPLNRYRTLHDRRLWYHSGASSATRHAQGGPRRGGAPIGTAITHGRNVPGCGTPCFRASTETEICENCSSAQVELEHSNKILILILH